MDQLLPFSLYALIFLPLIAAGLLAIPRLPARPVALLTATILVLLTALVAGKFNPQATGFQFTASLPVIDEPQLALAVGVDGMSLIMTLLSVLVLLAALWCVPAGAPHARLTYAGSLLIGAGALGAFLSTDLVVFLRLPRAGPDSRRSC